MKELDLSASPDRAAICAADSSSVSTRRRLRWRGWTVAEVPDYRVDTGPTDLGGALDDAERAAAVRWLAHGGAVPRPFELP